MKKVIVYILTICMLFSAVGTVSFASEGQNETLKKAENLYVCGNGKNSINITWDGVSGATGYIVYRAKAIYEGKTNFMDPVDEEDFVSIATVTETSYTDSDVKVGDYHIYYYMIQPIKGEGETYAEGPYTHAQPGIVKLTGANKNALPSIEFKLLDHKTTAPGELRIKVKVKDIDKKLIPALRSFEFRDYIGGDGGGAAAIIPAGKTTFEKIIKMNVDGNSECKLDESYRFGKNEIARLTLDYLYKSSLGKRSGMSIEYPIWSYDTDMSYEIVSEFDNIGFRAWLTDKNITSRIKSMDDGEIAFLKIRGNWNPNGIVKKEYLDAIKGTNKVIIARIIDEGGGAYDWIFYGNKLKTTKDIRIGYMIYIDIADNGEDSYCFGFYSNGTIPAGVEIRIHTLSFKETMEGTWNNKIKNSYNRVTFDNTKNRKVRTKVPGEITNEGMWLYFKINPKYSISKQDITISCKNFSYNGKNRRPAVTVKKENRKLLKNTDYTVTYSSSSKNMGRYKVVVKGKKLFAGTKTFYYTVGPKAPSKVTGKVSGNNLVVKWNKVDKASGYAVYYKATEQSAYKLVAHTSKRTYTIKSIDNTKKYKVKIVPYKTIKKNKCYGGYKVISL